MLFFSIYGYMLDISTKKAGLLAPPMVNGFVGL